MCVSKGITSGTLPLAATLTSEKIYKAFYADYTQKKTFYHGHTYTANPLSCQAALATLRIFQEENTLERVEKLIPLLHSKIEELRTLEFVGDVRYLGMIAGIEIVKKKSTKQPFSLKKRVGYKIYKSGLKNGLILRPLGDVIYLYLPLNIKESELLLILRRLYKILKNIREIINKE